MAAVSTVILRSMRMIGEKGRGETLTSAEQTETLAELNSFMESLNLERLMCYAVDEDTLALTTSTASYSVGTNGTFAIDRPVKLVDPCFIRDSSGFDTPVKLINAATYGTIVDKAAGYTVPTYLFYDANYSATSTATINLYPSPSSGLTLHINSWKQLGSFSTLSQTVNFPPGYQLMIESNFALHLAAGFVDPPAATVKIAKESKAAIKTVNVPADVMMLDPGTIPNRIYGVNIFTG